MLSRKILFIVIGLTISMLITVNAYSADCDCTNTDGYNAELAAKDYGSNTENTPYKEHLVPGIFLSEQAALDALHAYAQSIERDDSFTNSGAQRWNQTPPYYDYRHVTLGGILGKEDNSGTYSATIYTIQYWGDNSCPPCQALDSDDDGIPDQFDLYPNDPDPYEIWGMVSYTDDSGNQIITQIKTSKGDWFSIADVPPDKISYIGKVDGSQMSGSEYADILDGQPDGLDDVSFGGLDIADYNPSSDSMTSVTGEDELIPSDPSMVQSGLATGMESVNGNETTDELSQKSISNQGRIADYLSAIQTNTEQLKNQGLGAISNETDMTGVESRLDNINGKFDDMPTQAEQDSIDSAISNAETNADNDIDNAEIELDDAKTEADNQILPDATLVDDAPAEYQQKTDIATELDNLILNNPITTILDNSSVQVSGSPTASFVAYGETIDLTVAPLESALVSFGNILIMITTLTGIVMVVRG